MLITRFVSPGLLLAGLKVQLTHDAADELVGAGSPQWISLGVDSSVAVRL